LRAAQLARALGADLAGVGEIPSAVDHAYRARRDDRRPPPARLIEFVGGGINQWTAAEGALKIREAAYVASEGLAAEQFLHGPSVALGPDDRLENDVALHMACGFAAKVRQLLALHDGQATALAGTRFPLLLLHPVAHRLSVRSKIFATCPMDRSLGWHSSAISALNSD
jgi:hypothetical protein